VEGWIKLHRKLKNWEWYKDSKTLHVFIHLLINANYNDGKWKGYKVKRGQLITGRKSISESTGISERSVRTAIKRLKSTSEVTIKVTSKFSLVTICNYGKYQPLETQGDQQTVQQVTSKRPASDQQVTTNKKLKKLKKVKNINKKPFGEFDNVLLTQDEYEKLKNKFNSSFKDKIDNLSVYLESKGGKYKSHYATILAWDRKDKPKRKSAFI